MEPHSNLDLGLDDWDCHLLQPVDRLWWAQCKTKLLFILPLVVAISFLLIADIDSPRGGFIHVVPQNLVALAQSLPN